MNHNGIQISILHVEQQLRFIGIGSFVALLSPVAGSLLGCLQTDFILLFSFIFCYCCCFQFDAAWKFVSFRLIHFIYKIIQRYGFDVPASAVVRDLSYLFWTLVFFFSFKTWMSGAVVLGSGDEGRSQSTVSIRIGCIIELHGDASSQRRTGREFCGSEKSDETEMFLANHQH